MSIFTLLIVVVVSKMLIYRKTFIFTFIIVVL